MTDPPTSARKELTRRAWPRSLILPGWNFELIAGRHTGERWERSLGLASKFFLDRLPHNRLHILSRCLSFHDRAKRGINERLIAPSNRAILEESDDIVIQMYVDSALARKRMAHRLAASIGRYNGIADPPGNGSLAQFGCRELRCVVLVHDPDGKCRDTCCTPFSLAHWPSAC